MPDLTLSRRRFLAASTAAAALLPVAAAVGAAEAEAAVAAPVSTVVAGSWGYSADGGELWHINFPTQEAALEEALDWTDSEAVEIGYCTPLGFSYGGGAEACAEWLCCGHCSLAEHLKDRLAGANEDADFEGEFAYNVENSPADFAPAAQRALAGALIRAGDIESAATVLAGGIVDTDPFPDSTADAIERDPVLETELERILREWGIAMDLEAAPQTLSISQQSTHDVPEDVV